MTGKIKMVADDAAIHNALRPNTKPACRAVKEWLAIVEKAFCTDSGNISVKPHSRSTRVSSSS